MHRLTLCLTLALSLLVGTLELFADHSVPLDNAAVVQMVKWGFKDQEIIADIARNATNFELTPTTIAGLKANGVSDAVLDAMFSASKRAGADVALSAARGLANTNPAAPRINPASSPESKPATTPVQPPANTPPTKPGANQPQVTIIPAHTPQRFSQAIHSSATPPDIPNFNASCPPDNKGKTPSQSISLYFPSGTSDPTAINDSGSVCFEVHDFNDILYTPSFTFAENAPSGNAFDDLQAAIKSVTGLTFSSTDTTSPAKSQQKQSLLLAVAPRPVCPPGLSDAITAAQGEASRFSAALAGIDPGKDSSGNVNLVDWQTTTAKWQPVPAAYRQFEAAVSQVIAGLNMSDADVCSDDVLSAAEAVVLDAYAPARTQFAVLQGHVNSNHIVPFTARVHATSSYTVTVAANSPQGKVAGGSVTFSLAAGRKILSTSAGFLVTDVPTPSYASVTAPNGSTGTQNVLAVNNPSGASVGLTALVDVYLPNIHFGTKKLSLNGSSWGLALSAGPTYNLANGKADTTKFGLFAGPSLHIRNQFFLTPGFNLAQYSALPLGFTQAGQVIPPGVGTPTGIPHWTTRFAFALTYKIKDFGQSSTPTQVTGTAAPQTAKPAPPPKTPGGN